MHYFDSEESTSNLVPRDLHPPSTPVLCPNKLVIPRPFLSSKNKVRRWVQIARNKVWSLLFLPLNLVLSVKLESDFLVTDFDVCYL